MKKSDSFRDYVLDQLREAGRVECRAMFGGYGLYRSGRIFGILYKGRFYLKVDDATRPAFVKAGIKPFKPNARQTMKGYYEVPPDVLENAAELARRVSRA
jgi:DNA transformation protein